MRYTAGRDDWRARGSQASDAIVIQNGKVAPVALIIADTPVPLAADAHGVLRVAGTRVTLDSVIASFRAGATAEEIALQYPSVNLTAIYATLTFYLRQREEVETYLREREQQDAAVRQEIQARFPSAGIRERLLARRAAAGP